MKTHCLKAVIVIAVLVMAGCVQAMDDQKNVTSRGARAAAREARQKAVSSERVVNQAAPAEHPHDAVEGESFADYMKFIMDRSKQNSERASI